MRVEERIAAAARQRAGDRLLDTVCIGVGYTGVRLSDGSGGVSYTFRGDLGPTCGVIPGAGRMLRIVAEGGGGMALSPASEKLLERIQ